VNALSLYNHLERRGVVLEAQGDHLKVDAPVGVLTDGHRSAGRPPRNTSPSCSSYCPAPREEPQEAPERESVARWAGAHKDTRPLYGRVAQVAGERVFARRRDRSGQAEERKATRRSSKP